MLLKNVGDIDMLLKAVDKCRSEEFSLKSSFSKYLAIGRLADEHGDEYEMFCLNKDDEPYMLQFFYDIEQENKNK